MTAAKKEKDDTSAAVQAAIKHAEKQEAAFYAALEAGRVGINLDSFVSELNGRGEELSYESLTRPLSRTGSKIPRRGRGKAPASLRLILAARKFLETAHPTTVRGVCYHLFTQGVIPSMSKGNTSRVSRLLTDARKDGSIPWEWIVDETRELERVSSWDDPAEYVKTVRHSYRKDFWAYQPNGVEVWSEKGTVRGVLKPVLDEYGVGFRVLHGFGSFTALKEIATRTRRDNQTLLYGLYVGDWDPSGLHMSEIDVPDRALEYGGDHVRVERIALAAEDVQDSALPSFPASDKHKDPRYNWFVENYGDRCWELDAMDPNVLRERVQQAIEDHIDDREAWKRCDTAQKAEQSSLEKVLDQWTALKK